MAGLGSWKRGNHFVSKMVETLHSFQLRGFQSVDGNLSTKPETVPVLIEQQKITNTNTIIKKKIEKRKILLQKHSMRENALICYKQIQFQYTFVEKRTESQ